MHVEQIEQESACVIAFGRLQIVLKDNWSKFGFPAVMQVFTNCCRVTQADSAHEESALVDLFHRAPRLWDFLDGNSLKTLLSVSREIRDQAIEQVHRIRIAQHSDWCHLTCSNWPGLKVLDVWSSRVDAEMLHSCSNRWPLLQALSIPFARLDQAAISALNTIEWPYLRQLNIVATDDAMRDLMKCNWPQLRDVTIAGNLHEDGLKYLRNCPWSGLQQLQLSVHIMTRYSTDCLVRGYLPSLQELSLVGFELNCANLTQERIEILLTGNWPCLHTLKLNCFELFDEHIPILIKANWPALKLLSMDLGMFRTTVVLDLCMQRWPALKSLTLGKMRKHVSAAIFEQASRQWPSLDVQVTYSP